MIEQPRITQATAQHTAMIRFKIAHEEMRTVIGPGLKEIMQAIAAQGVAQAGPWLTHHLAFAPGRFDFELSVPVEKPIAAVGRVHPGLLPAGKVARTVYHGDYSGLPHAWPELDVWVRANGHTPREELWEVYTKGPESSPDASTWRTELNRTLA